MIVVALVSWWYSAGWLRQIEEVRRQLARAVESFSIGTLLATLFSPFRQIAAGNVRGPLAVKVRAWGDRTVSRFVGFMVRSIFILIGIGYGLLLLCLGVLRLVAWPLVPVLPLIALGLLVWRVI